MIEKYIKLSKNMQPHKSGSNSKCYVFDDVVLLVTPYPSDSKKMGIKKEKLDILKNNGVNVCRVLDYALDETIEYELQERAKGEELYYYRLAYTSLGQAKYLKMLDSISNQDINFFIKFLEDWRKILQLGFDVDPSKSTNFFYDGKSICFIDLNLTNNYEDRIRYMAIEGAVVLRGGGLLWQAKDVHQEANEKVKVIYQKYGKALLELGKNIDEYISFVDPNGDYELKEYFNSYKR